LKLAVIVLITPRRRAAARARGRPGRPDLAPARCPGCGAPLALNPAGTDNLDRFVAACKALQCVEVVTFRVCEGRFIVAERRRR
jgi:hypothetical protein